MKTEETELPKSIQAAASWSWRLVVIALAVAVSVYLINYLKVIIIPVVIAVMLTCILQPMMRFFQNYLHFPRVLAATVSLLSTMLGALTLTILAGREIVIGVSELANKASAGFDTLLQVLANSPLKLDTEHLSEIWDQALKAAQDNSETLINGALSFTTTLTQLLAGIVITLFCTLFFLIDGRRIWDWLVGLLPMRVRERSHQAGRRGLVTIAAYAKTQILVAGIDAVGIYLGAVFLKLPLALPLGFLVFIGSFIPFFGAVITGAIAVLVALVVKGWVAALIMLAVVLAVQQIEGNVLQPWLMGHAVSLHPVAVLLVVTTGTYVAGIIGALFAVPLAAVLNTIILYFHGHDKFPELGHDDHIKLRRPADKAIMVAYSEKILQEEFDAAKEQDSKDVSTETEAKPDN